MKLESSYYESGDFESHPRVAASEEVRHRALKELILAEDWQRRFSVNFAVLGAVNKMLANEQDPGAVMNLAGAKRVRLEETLGAGTVALWQRDVLAERQQFEDTFGW